MNNWVRIHDLGIYCSICGSPDWCRISADGKIALCSRVPTYKQEGTQHKLILPISNCLSKQLRKHHKAIINWYALNRTYIQNCPLWRVDQIGALLGVSSISLTRLEIGYDGEAYTFPLRDEKDVLTGIQRRFPDKKIMVKGSNLGIFIPRQFRWKGPTIAITEGVSDCAVALDLGLNPVGRLNNSSGNKILANISGGLNVVIVADNDKAGQEGAVKLGNLLKSTVKSVKIIIPPVKDLRAWKKKGLTPDEFKVIVRKVGCI